MDESTKVSVEIQQEFRIKVGLGGGTWGVNG